MFNPSKIKVIVWDVDGTWYCPTNELNNEEIRQRILFVAKKLGISFEEAKQIEEEKVKETKSYTKAVSELTKTPLVQLLKSAQKFINRKKYLKRDEKLKKLFSELSNFDHAIVSNMCRCSLNNTFKILGIEKEIFKVIVTPEEAMTTKPDLKPFLMVLEKTGFNPEEHLFVGDRESVDIVPAKKLGMQTCFVWGKSKVADVSLKTVYDLSKLLLR